MVNTRGNAPGAKRGMATNRPATLALAAFCGTRRRLGRASGVQVGRPEVQPLVAEHGFQHANPAVKVRRDVRVAVQAVLPHRKRDNAQSDAVLLGFVLAAPRIVEGEIVYWLHGPTWGVCLSDKLDPRIVNTLTSGLQMVSAACLDSPRSPNVPALGSSGGIRTSTDF